MRLITIKPIILSYEFAISPYHNPYKSGIFQICMDYKNLLEADTMKIDVSIENNPYDKVRILRYSYIQINN